MPTVRLTPLQANFLTWLLERTAATTEEPREAAMSRRILKKLRRADTNLVSTGERHAE